MARAVRPYPDGAHAAVVAWLTAGAKAKGSSAWWLAQAPVTDLHPDRLGQITWRPSVRNLAVRAESSRAPATAQKG